MQPKEDFSDDNRLTLGSMAWRGSLSLALLTLLFYIGLHWPG